MTQIRLGIAGRTSYFDGFAMDLFIYCGFKQLCEHYGGIMQYLAFWACP